MKHKVFVFIFLVFIFSRSVNAQEQYTVEQVVAMALEKNYDVLLSKNISQAATTDYNYTWGAFLPQLNANGSYTANNNSQHLEFPDTVREADNVRSDNLSASLQLTWTLFDGTRMFATRQRIAEIAEQGELVVKDQMVNTVAQIITSYYDIVRQKQQLKAIQEQMAVSEERVKLADRKLQVGTGGKPELLQAKVDLNAQRTQVIQQEAIILQLKEQLSALTGDQLPTVYEVSDTIIIDLDLKQEEIQNNIENRNFGLLATRKDLNIAYLTLHERKAERFPQINFNAAYNFSRTENKKLVNPFSALINQNKGYNYGLSVTLPILNGFNNRRLIQQAHINIDFQQLLYDQQKLNVDVAVQNAYVNYENAKKILLIEEDNILLARENVFIALESFKRGVATFIELRTAQQSLGDAYNRLIAARYNAKAAETELLRLNGDLLN